MYYRRGFYPRAGQADVPDDLWAEFQKIRGNLSNLDQNNVDSKTLQMETIVPPTDRDHNGVSDIIDEDEKFLHKTTGNQPPHSHPSLESPDIWSLNPALSKDRWIDLGKYGLTLRAQSRGDTPWVVGASIDACVYYALDGTDVTDGSLIFNICPSLASPLTLFGGDLAYPGLSKFTASHLDRANLRLRIKSSHDGLSTAEAVGGFNKLVFGCSIATVTTVLSSGGPIEFSPSVRYSELSRSSPPGWAGVGGSDTPQWGLRIVHANIFAFALNN